MSEPRHWVIRLPADDAGALGAIRLRNGIEVCESDGLVWARGKDAGEELIQELHKIAADGLYEVDADGCIVPAGKLLPTGVLPDAEWEPLATWIVPRPQPAAPPGRAPGQIPLRLVRSEFERAANLLLTTIDSWAAYASNAPAVRLAALTVAGAANGRVLVRGTPLPPIQATRYTELEGIAIPCGWRLDPMVDPQVVRVVLKLNAGEVAMFDLEGGYERISPDAFSRASRSGARQTLAELRR